MFGVRVQAKEWFKSYLLSRSYCIIYGRKTSVVIQVHVHCDHCNALSSVNVLEQCVTANGHWMSANRLKLNAEKTKLIWAGTRYTITSFLRLHDPTLTLAIDNVKADDAVHRTSHLRST